MCQPSLEEPVTEMNSWLGYPKFYKINTDANGIPMLRIHYSRVIRLTGDELPYYQRQAENMWSCSVLEALWDRLIAYDSVTMGVAQLVFKAHLRVLKLPSFREIVAEGGDTLNAVMQMIDTIRMFQNIEGLTVIDAEDAMEFNSYTFSGLPDTMKQFAEQISGSLNIPLVRLFGQSPSGFSTGDADLEMYNTRIKKDQRSKLRPGLSVLFPVMARSLTGKNLPSGWHYSFVPLKEMKEQDKSVIGKSDSDDVIAVEGSGLISPQTALKELRERGRSTGRWQTITDEEIAKADDEVAPPPDLTGGLKTPEQAGGTAEEGFGGSGKGGPDAGTTPKETKAQAGGKD
jgi:phage-related protein (TIGR01555 family)